MANPENYFKPGVSGNPKGAPKRNWTWAGVYQKAVEESEADGKPVKHHIAKALVKEAKKGNILAVKELANRMDGMPMQPTDLTTKGEKFPTPIYDGKSNNV